MPIPRTYLRHALFAVLGVYVVFTLAFAVVALTPDPNQAVIAYRLARRGQADLIDNRLAAYRAARNLDVPVTVRYVRWLVDVTLLDWGRSFTTGRPVLATMRDSLRYTLAYLVPGFVLGTTGGVVAGLTGALSRRPSVDRGLSTLSYVAFGVPSFYLAAVFLVGVAPTVEWFPVEIRPGGPLSSANRRYLLVPAVILGVNVFAGQLRYARAKGRQLVRADFVQQLRAVGVPRRKLARHLLRNAAVPLLSVSLADLVAILVVNVFVIEYVFEIPGLGLTAYRAVDQRDVPVVVGATIVVAVAGIAANVLQEVANAFLDPRVGDDGGDRE
jgi:peptide/nickel transport system permease protein